MLFWQQVPLLVLKYAYVGFGWDGLAGMLNVLYLGTSGTVPVEIGDGTSSGFELMVCDIAIICQLAD